MIQKIKGPYGPFFGQQNINFIIYKLHLLFDLRKIEKTAVNKLVKLFRIIKVKLLKIRRDQNEKKWLKR